MNQFEHHLRNCRLLHVQQTFEAFELLGFETRNKYRILDEDLRPVAFAAEQRTGITGAILRHILGHWRSFEVIIFDENKQKALELKFPFRWFFKTLFVNDKSGQKIGHLQQRFALFRKKFDVFDKSGRQVARINSSFFRFWTFEFFHHNRSLGKVQKKWSGSLGEFFTDKDNFVVTYQKAELDYEIKALMLSTCIMIDVIYFEENQGNKSLGVFD